MIYIKKSFIAQQRKLDQLKNLSTLLAALAKFDTLDIVG